MHSEHKAFPIHEIQFTATYSHVSHLCEHMVMAVFIDNLLWRNAGM